MVVADSQIGMLQSTQSTNFRVSCMPDWKAWTVQEASEKTGYNAEYIRRLCRQGEIEHDKIGRVLLIKAESLMKYVEEMKSKDDNRYGPKEK